MQGRMTSWKRSLAAIACAGCVGGCLALFDFDGYDPTRVAQEPPDGASADPFTIRISPTTLSGTSEQTATVRVTVERRQAADAPITLGVSGAKEVSLARTTEIAGGATEIDAVLALGNMHGPQTIALTATSSAYPGFTASASLSLYIRGKAGTLDTSFASGGVFETAFSGDAKDLAVLPDDRILIAGVDYDEGTTSRFALLRVRVDGSLDPSFGVGGRAAVLGASAGPGGASCVALGLDGRASVAGHGLTPRGEYVVLVDGDGRAVPSFGDGGAARFGDDACQSLQLASDGKIFVVTVRSTLRRLPGGEPDTTFGDGGTALETLTERLSGAILDVERTRITGTSGDEGLVARELGPTGDLQSGSAVKPADHPSCYASSRPARLADGRVLLVGTCARPVIPTTLVDRRATFAALLPDGGLDRSFADGGLAVASKEGEARAVVAVGGGYASVTSGSLSVNAALELTRHDARGTAIWTFTPEADTLLARASVNAAAVDRSGRIIVVGSSRMAGGSPRAFVARFWL
jgi:uncharacterized delta-60 repeat protein